MRHQHPDHPVPRTPHPDTRAEGGEAAEARRPRGDYSALDDVAATRVHSPSTDLHACGRTARRSP